METSEVAISIVSNTSEILDDVKNIWEARLKHDLVIEVLLPCRTVL